MKYWIKRGGRLFGGAVFFAVLICMMIQPEAWRFPYWITALGSAAACGVIGWFVGTVICDILLKGICADIGEGDADILVEGGMLQRFQMMNEQLAPGGTEMPFANMAPEKKTGRQTKRK
jgi:hypothetical protein